MRSFIQSRFPAHYLKLRGMAKLCEKGLRELRLICCGIPRTLSPLRTALRLPRSGHIHTEDLSPEEGQHFVVDRPRVFSRQLPRFPEEASPPPRFLATASGTYPETGLTRLTKARLWTRYGGSVITNQDRLVAELSKDIWGIHRHSAHTKLSLRAARRLPGRTLSLITPEAEKNYHHWMMDLIPRLRLVKAAGLAPNEFDTILIKSAALPYQSESLRAAGIDEARIIRVGDDEMFLCDELCVPSLRDDTSCIPPEDMQFIRDLFLPKPSGTAPSPASVESRREVPAITHSRKLYLSRRDAAFRHVHNEEALVSVLEAQGFECVVLSRIPLHEQAKLFSEASLIVSPSSAALANLVFAPAGCQIIELLAPRWIVPFTWITCDNMRQTLTCLIGNGPRPSGSELPQGIQDDIQIEESSLVCVIETLRNPAPLPPPTIAS